MKRGVSVNPMFFYSEGGSIAELEEWGVNLVRLHIIEGHHTLSQGFMEARKIAFEAWQKGSPIQFMWNIRLQCRCDYREHLKVWKDFINVLMVDRLPNTWGYDVVNEPTDDDEAMAGYRGALPVLHEAMRSLTDKWLVFQSGWGGTDSGFENLAPFGDEKTMYAHNIYAPWRYTSQGLQGKTRIVPIPDDLPEAIRAENEHFFHFNDTWPEAKLMVPEFGLSRYIPEDEATAYIDTLVPMLEERGISWLWHTYPGKRNRPPRERLGHYWRLNAS